MGGDCEIPASEVRLSGNTVSLWQRNVWIVHKEASMSESQGINIPNGVGRIQELIMFVRERRSYWLAPVVFVLLLLATLIYYVEGAAVAPFIYSIF